MKKIYYLQKHEVKLGDIIECNGIKTLVTKELIELNPELFVVEGTMQELLDKAKRDYPIGTMFNSKYGVQKVLSGKPFIGRAAAGTVQINTDQFPGGMTIYNPEDGWAEILPLKFITEDGVSIYGDMKTYLVRLNKDNANIDSSLRSWDGGLDNKYYKYFYHKENALAYIEKHKEKTLEDYENMILRTDIDSINAREVCWFYHILKKKEPKLYYTKILQLIADDLNDGWIADFTNYDDKWCISIKDILHYVNLQIHGLVYFKEYGLAEKARDILGDKVKYLFN